MQSRYLSTRTTVAAALLSAFIVIEPSYAGLLGGGAGAGLGGGLAGGFGNRQLDFAGSGGGQASQELRTPRADAKAADAAHGSAPAANKQEAFRDQGRATGRAAAGATSDRAATAHGRAGHLAAATSGQASAMASAAHGEASDTDSSAPGAAVSKDAAVSTRPASADASAAGSAQTSRTDRSASAGGSAQASARR